MLDEDRQQFQPRTNGATSGPLGTTGHHWATRHTIGSRPLGPWSRLQFLAALRVALDTLLREGRRVILVWFCPF